MRSIPLADGKYTVQYDPDTSVVTAVLRHGEPWPAGSTINNLELAMVHRIVELEDALLAHGLPVPGRPSVHPVGAPPHASVSLYVDGACLVEAGSLRFGWAYRLLQANGELLAEFANSDILSDWVAARNVAAELTATIEGLRRAEALHASAVTVYHDYEGIGAWADGRWKAKQAMTQTYVAFLRTLSIPVTFVHVKAHTGHPENERVDRLANQAARLATPVPNPDSPSSR